MMHFMRIFICIFKSLWIYFCTGQFMCIVCVMWWILTSFLLLNYISLFIIICLIIIFPNYLKWKIKTMKNPPLFSFHFFQKQRNLVNFIIYSSSNILNYIFCGISSKQIIVCGLFSFFVFLFFSFCFQLKKNNVFFFRSLLPLVKYLLSVQHSY